MKINQTKEIFYFFQQILLILFFSSCNRQLNTKTHYSKLEKDSELICRSNSKYISRFPASGDKKYYQGEELQDVEIPTGTTTYLHKDLNIGKLIVRGTLLCDEKNANEVITVRANSIIVFGKFQCGSSSNPYRKKLIISLKKTNSDPKQDPDHRGLIVENEGEVALFGETHNAGWKYLKQHANMNDNYILVENSSLINSKNTLSESLNIFNSKFEKQLSWKVGDSIVLGPTAYNSEEAEDFTIISIDPIIKNKFYLDRPIKYFHWGKRQFFPTSSKTNTSIELNERAEVANLTRSILIKADEVDHPVDEENGYDSQIGAHVMVHHQGKAFISGVEFYKMGQAGILGRYPFHWHLSGNVNGQFIKNSSIHHSYQRCIVIHQTSYATVQNNVCYNFKGHGIFLEDGSEVNNKILQNLTINAKAPSPTKILLQSDSINNSENAGRFPSVSGIWISHPYNDVRFNTVSGSIGSGIWMSFLDNFIDKNGENFSPTTSLTKYFDSNTAHSCQVGFTWDGSAIGGNANNPNNPNDKTLDSAYYTPAKIPVFNNLIAFKNKLTGIYFRGNTAVFKNAVMADNGWSFWVTFNQILKDSVFIGKTNNSSSLIDQSYYQNNRVDRYRKSGAVLYDGPMEIHNTSFLNFSTQKSSYKLNSQTFNNTVIPFIGIGGTNKYMNFTSGLSFFPEPVHRMHLLDSLELPKDRQLLGNQSIRDLDGTLANTSEGKVIVGIRSLGIINSKQCQNGNESLYNFQVCPSNYTESSVNYMLWGSSFVSPWSTPFVVRRNDGLIQNPISEWNDFKSKSIANNAFSIANDDSFIYELLPYSQYEYNVSINAEARLEANSELQHSKSPLIKIIAYGNNCQLEDATAVGSVEELKKQLSTSYYSKGENFYVKLVPSVLFQWITPHETQKATGYSTPKRHLITCARGFINREIRGMIESVTRGISSTTIKGWACNFTSDLAIDVKLYTGLRNGSSTTPKGGYLSPLLLSTSKSNLTPDPQVSILCGSLGGYGKRFSFTVNNQRLNNIPNHYFFVEGISNTGGNKKFIDKSGYYPVMTIQNKENENSSTLPSPAH